MSETLHLSLSPLTSLSERPPAGDPAEQVWFQLVGGRRQACRSSVFSKKRRCWSVKLKQGQVIVLGLIVIILVKMNVLHSSHFLCGAATVQEQFTQVDRPHGGGVEAAACAEGENTFKVLGLFILSCSFFFTKEILMFPINTYLVISLYFLQSMKRKQSSCQSLRKREVTDQSPSVVLCTTAK